MFTAYSTTYASQIAVLAGSVVVFARLFGFDFAEQDIVFATATLANFGGILWTLYQRYLKGDVTVGGFRK